MNMKIKMKTALSIFMILIMIGMMTIPAAMGSGDTPTAFTITISSGQSTAVTANTSTAFSEASPGDTAEIVDSFDLTNAGNAISTVAATFTTSNGSVYGLDATGGYIGGENFSLSSVGGTYTALDNLDSDTQMNADTNVAADNVSDVWKAQ